MMREPIDLPPIVSVELIEIKDKTYIPFAPKARKIIEKVKEEKKRVVSEQAPPASKAKEKPDRIPMPEDKEEIKELIKKKQNPEEIKPKIRQASEFEKEELFDTNEIAALIDKAKEEQAETQRKKDELTQSSVKNSFAQGLSLSEEDALRAQIFGCWSVPLGLPYDKDLLVRIKLKFFMEPSWICDNLPLRGCYWCNWECCNSRQSRIHIRPRSTFAVAKIITHHFFKKFCHFNTLVIFYSGPGRILVLSAY